MSLLKYFQKAKKEGILVLPGKEICGSLSNEDVKAAGEKIQECLQASGTESNKRGKYNQYDAEKRAQIGRYASENGPTRASRHFDVPEPTARRLKVEYLHKLKEMKSTYNEGSCVPVVKRLPTKSQGRPLMLGEQLDAAVRDYIQGMRTVGGVVNTTIVLAAAEGIITARDQSLLVKNGGHIQLTKSWAKSLLKRMGYVKRKCSNAGKISIFRFEEIRSDFLADIQAEIVMNEIPEELVSTGTRHHFSLFQQVSGPCIRQEIKLFLLLTVMINAKSLVSLLPLLKVNFYLLKLSIKERLNAVTLKLQFLLAGMFGIVKIIGQMRSQ